LGAFPKAQRPAEQRAVDKKDGSYHVSCSFSAFRLPDVMAGLVLPCAGHPRGRKIDNFLTSRPALCYRFSELIGKPARASLRGTGAHDFVRKETEVKSLKTNDPTKWPVSPP
jgi:hypothetical protein